MVCTDTYNGYCVLGNKLLITRDKYEWTRNSLAITEPSTSVQSSCKTQNGEGTPTMIQSTHFQFITSAPPQEETFPGHDHRRWIRWFTLFPCLCSFVSSLSDGSLFLVPSFHAQASLLSIFIRLFFSSNHNLVLYAFWLAITKAED